MEGSMIQKLPGHLAFLLRLSLSLAVVVAWCGAAKGVVLPTPLSFQEGDGGVYSQTQATFVALTRFGFADVPSTNFGSDSLIAIAADRQSVGLIRFADLLGTDVGQLPTTGVTIISATLTLTTEDPAANEVRVHRVVRAWDESAVTYNNFIPTVGANPGEDYIPSDVVGLGPSLDETAYSFDVTGIVQAWADGEANLGFAIAAESGTDTASFYSDDAGSLALRPLLQITYVPEPSSAVLGLLGAAWLIRYRRRSAG